MTSMTQIIDTELGRSWAALLEEQTGHWWHVVWRLYGQSFSAFYRGYWEHAGGVCLTASTPYELWAAMRDVQAEGRRQAMTAQTVVPPLLVEDLPTALRRADG